MFDFTISQNTRLFNLGDFEFFLGIQPLEDLIFL